MGLLYYACSCNILGVGPIRVRTFHMVVVLLGMVFSFAAAQGRVPVRDAASYDIRDAHEGVTFVAEAYAVGQEKTKAVFGKSDPNSHGVLPVYVVVFNPTKDAINLAAMKITFETADGKRCERVDGDKLSRMITGVSLPKGMKPGKAKPPIASIVDQEFLVKMVPPGDTIGGFLYFDQPPAGSGWSLYLTGLKWASTRNDLMFFELRKP